MSRRNRAGLVPFLLAIVVPAVGFGTDRRKALSTNDVRRLLDSLLHLAGYAGPNASPVGNTRPLGFHDASVAELDGMVIDFWPQKP